ncbi:MAG: hypothetical protein L3K19_06265 [Thermoplasmata archaeon]|nr:hypothetical protein [Thermoplasmata archaeon]
MTGWEPALEHGLTPRLDDRVLDFLNKRTGTIAFSGLRRALGAHPESLTRALRRLERGGAVRRDDSGYSLTVPGPDPGPSPEAVSARAVATVQLPPAVSRDTLFGILAGRWSGPLRWVGVYDRPGDPWLAWSLDETPGHVLLSVKKGTLRVLVDLPRDNAEGVRLEGAADDLLLRILERLKNARDPGPASATALARGGGTGAYDVLWNLSLPSAPRVDMEGALGPSAS